MRHCFEANFMDIAKRTPWKKKKTFGVFILKLFVQLPVTSNDRNKSQNMLFCFLKLKSKIIYIPDGKRTHYLVILLEAFCPPKTN